MTRRIGEIVVIEEECPQKCEFCGQETETRPYGPQGKEMCYKCMMETPERKRIAEDTFQKVIDGV